MADADQAAVAPIDRRTTGYSPVERVGCERGIVDRDRRGDRRGNRRRSADPRRSAQAGTGSGASGASPLTLYVDGSHWWFRERHWCHLVSDTSLDELHDFAASLGMTRRAFHGDHYDLPDEYRARAVAAGAQEVTSRDVVRILRTAGLRRDVRAVR